MKGAGSYTENRSFFTSNASDFSKNPGGPLLCFGAFGVVLTNGWTIQFKRINYALLALMCITFVRAPIDDATICLSEAPFVALVLEATTALVRWFLFLSLSFGICIRFLWNPSRHFTPVRVLFVPVLVYIDIDLSLHIVYIHSCMHLIGSIWIAPSCY